MTAEVTTTPTRAQRREWTHSEIKSLKDSYSIKGAKFVAEELGRDIASIYQKATKLGLKSASRMTHAPIAAPDGSNKVRAYRRKTKFIKPAPVAADTQSIKSEKPTQIKSKGYDYRVAIDEVISANMTSDILVSKHSIVILNIEQLRVRCFVEDVIQNSDGSYLLNVSQVALSPTLELFESK